MLLEPKRTPYDLRWRMFGIPVRVHPFFWLTTIGLVLIQDSGKQAPLYEIAIWSACVFFSIVLHEFGHALTGRYCGERNQRVWLYGLGGLACSDGGATRKQRILILIMGPGAGFLLYGTILGLSHLLGEQITHSYLLMTIEFLIWINLYWGLLNLLPVYPLDGGQILMEFTILRRGRGVESRVHGMCMVFAILAGIGLTAYDAIVKDDQHLFYLIMFGYLFYLNFQLRRVSAIAGYDEAHEPRQPWERDPDWWKNSN